MFLENVVCNMVGLKPPLALNAVARKLVVHCFNLLKAMWHLNTQDYTCLGTLMLLFFLVEAEIKKQAPLVVSPLCQFL